VQTVEPFLRRGASLEVDTSVPIAQVVEIILGHVQHCKECSDTDSGYGFGGNCKAAIAQPMY
jgi:hypothetical protein